MFAIFESIRAFGEVFFESIKQQNLIDIVCILEQKIMVDKSSCIQNYPQRN